MSNLIISPPGEKSKDVPMLMAFPLFGVAPGALPGTATVIMQGGMELRDYFAGQYLAGFEDRNKGDVEMSQNAFPGICKTYAKICYVMADAMMEAREARKK